MATRLNPYLNFRGTAREAMQFYQSIFGGELTSNSFGEFGMEVPDGEKDNIMHSQLSGGAVEFMAADVPSDMDFHDGAGNITMSLFGEDDAPMSGYFDKLAEGGTVGVSLEQAPWGDKFGMLTDKFGIAWMVNISGAAQG